MSVIHVGPDTSFVVYRSSILVGCLLVPCSSRAAAEVSHKLFDTQVPEVLVTKHVLLRLRQVETWVRILWVLRHMGWISWATKFTRRNELRADQDARLRAPNHVEAK